MIRVSALLATLTVAALAAPPKSAPPREAELSALKAQVAAVRDSLQREIAERWRAKQRAVQQREADKEDLDARRERQEQAYADLARVKEECFAREREIADAETKLAELQDQWGAVNTSLADLLAKDAAGVMQAFPPDREVRRRDLEEIRQSLRKNGDAGAVVNAYVLYRAEGLDRARALSLTRETIMPDDGGAAAATLARFGTVFAYGIDEQGAAYTVRQSGRLGSDRYRIDKIASAELSASLARLFPSWVSAGAVEGSVPVDVMQNEQSGVLIAGKKITSWQSFVRSIRAGGAVMVPLLLLPFWAAALVAIKLWQFGLRRRRTARQVRTVLGLLHESRDAEARTFLAASKGPSARMLEACLSLQGRASAEKTARTIFAEDASRLNSHLNTLAVIAGAAPLLGLLGTISGMITLFAAVTHYGTGDPKFLAGGISEALITAKTGLAIAIPVLFVHNYLRNSRDRIVAEMEQAAMKVLNAREESERIPNVEYRTPNIEQKSDR